MSDLRSQLLAQFPTLEEETPSSPPPSEEDSLPEILREHALYGSPWMQQLRQLLSGPLGKGMTLKARPSQQATSQITDRLLKRLKQEGRRRERSQLQEARADFLRRRERAAWSAIKEQFSAAKLSDKAYRSLKQEKGVDPAQVLQRLRKEDPSRLQAMGAKRIRALLLGQS